jgi:hypothetical protein
MKRLFIITTLVGWVALLPSVMRACDICGCSGSAQTLGLLPLVQRHLVGARWLGQGYRTVPHGSALNSREDFHSFDLWGRWMPHPRWQAMAFAPYQYHLRRFDEGPQQRIRGLGDVSLLVQFSILDPYRSASGRWRHAFQVGGGFKLPTGDFRRRAPMNGLETVLPPALQPGTGSTDGLLSALYVVSTRRWGASVDGSLRLTGKNSDGYRFGSRAIGAVRLFHIGNWQRVTWTPYLGAQWDHRGADLLQGRYQPETGGWVALANAGVEVFARNVAISLTWSQPLVHHLSEGFVTPGPRFSTSVAVFLGTCQRVSKPIPPVPFLFPNVQPDTKLAEQ